MALDASSTHPHQQIRYLGPSLPLRIPHLSSSYSLAEISSLRQSAQTSSTCTKQTDWVWSLDSERIQKKTQRQFASSRQWRLEKKKKKESKLESISRTRFRFLRFFHFVHRGMSQKSSQGQGWLSLGRGELGKKKPEFFRKSPVFAGLGTEKLVCRVASSFADRCDFFFFLVFFSRAFVLSSLTSLQCCVLSHSSFEQTQWCHRIFSCRFPA